MSGLFDWPRQLLGMAPRALLEPVTGHPADQARRRGLEIDAEGWLVDPGHYSDEAGPLVEIVPSVRHSALSTPQGPIAILWHYTATDYGSARNLAKRIVKYKRKVDRAASWHVCIGADGTLWQSVSFLRGSWHCRKGTVAGHRMNACSVGVELEGHGTAFPSAQVAGAELLVRALHETYGIRREHASHGHVEFDPTRRSDPGPVWKELLPRLLERAYS